MKQYIYVDENGLIWGVATHDKGIEVETDINCSDALNDEGLPKYEYVDGTVKEINSDD